MWNSFSTSDGNKIGKEELSLKLTRVENYGKWSWWIYIFMLFWING